MGRKPKYNSTIKVEAVENYLKGIESCSKIMSRLDIYGTTLYHWIDIYKLKGISAFEETSSNNTYSKELKKRAINDYLNGEGSYRDICLKYQIKSKSILLSWVNKYNNHIEAKAYKPYEKDDIYMSKDKKYTFEEKLEIAQWVLANNDDYIQAASKFDVSYQNVYTWSKKYLDKGECGLKDNRGKKKAIEELSELEKLKKENDLLKVKLQRSEMEKNILKKLDEIERSVLASKQREK